MLGLCRMPSHFISYASILRRDIEIPINLTLFAIALPEPLVRLLEVTAVEETSSRAQRRRVHTLQHKVLARIDLRASLLRRVSPG